MTMRAFQVHYTSCRQGTSGRPGFQVRARTTDLPSTEEAEIVSQGGYKPPRNAAHEPTREEILRDFPRAFRFYNLESGRWAITSSCYGGEDYSGRRGNYFAHTLVPMEGDPTTWPIDYYEWEGWKIYLPPEEDTDVMPPPLDSVDMSAISPATSFTFSKLAGFLKEDLSRPAVLEKMIRSVFLALTNSRPMVVRDTHLNNIFWIACCVKAFPVRLMSHLTFSTYQTTTRNVALLNATTEQTDFAFSPTERNFQFYMFDLTTGNHSEVPTSSFEYASKIAEWAVLNHQWLEVFHQFMAMFEGYPLDEKELDTALRLFRAIQKDLTPDEMTADQLSSVIQFLVGYVRPSYREASVVVLQRILAGFGKAVRYGDFQNIVGYCAEVAAESGKKAYQDATFDIWIRMFNCCLADGGNNGIEEVVASRKTVVTKLTALQSRLAEMFLQPESVERLKSSFESATDDAILMIFEEAFQSLKALGRTPLSKQPEVSGLIASLLASTTNRRSKLGCMFRAVEHDASVIGEIALLSTEVMRGLPGDPRANQLDVGGAVADVLGRDTSNRPNIVRRFLAKSRDHVALFGEWHAILERSDDKYQALEKYSTAMRQTLPDYWNKSQELILDSYMRAVTPQQQKDSVEKWLRDGVFMSLPRRFAQEWIQTLNRSLPVHAKSEPDELGTQVVATAGELGVTLVPNKPLLRQLIGKVRHGKLEIAAEWLDHLAESLTPLTEAEYKSFLSEFLNRALIIAGTGAEQAQIISATFVGKYSRVFGSSYKEHLEGRDVRKNWRAGRDALLSWFLILKRGPELDPLWEELHPTFVQFLRKLDTQQLAAIEQAARSDKELGEHWKEVWQALTQSAQEVGRFSLKRLLRRGGNRDQK